MRLLANRYSIVLSALLVTGFLTVTVEDAIAVVYCQYVVIPPDAS
jgi:hypothetical protein